MDQQVSTEMKQNRMTEFMKLLPLTIELAGLARAATNTLYTPDQMEARAMNIRMAYKLARTMLKDVGESGAWSASVSTRGSAARTASARVFSPVVVMRWPAPSLSVEPHRGEHPGV